MRIKNQLEYSKKTKEVTNDLPPRGRRFGNFLRGRQGSMSVEFGILVPIFLMLIFGIVDFGHAWYMKMEITSASREAARYGTKYVTVGANPVRVKPNALNPLIAAWVQTNYAGLLPSDANLTVTPGGPGYTSGMAGDDLTVTVTAVKKWFVIGALVPGMGSSITLTGTSAMKVE